MKSIITLAILILTSCTTNAGTGVIAGTVIGGGIGGGVGGGMGGLIGSAAGILTGAIFGSVLDQQDRKVMEKSSPRTVDRMDRGDPLTINDVIKLSQGGVSDETILLYLRDSMGHYSLTQAQIRRLQDSGVSQRVISFMLDSGR